MKNRELYTVLCKTFNSNSFDVGPFLYLDKKRVFYISIINSSFVGIYNPAKRRRELEDLTNRFVNFLNDMNIKYNQYNNVFVIINISRLKLATLLKLYKGVY